MAYTINSAQIFSFSAKAEELHAPFKKLNLLIGESAEKMLNIIASTTCGVKSYVEEDVIANIKASVYEKHYLATVNFSSNLSDALVSFLDDTEEFNREATIEFNTMRAQFAFNTSNIFKNEKKTVMDEGLSDAQVSMINFREFVALLKNDTDKGDIRPIFISGFFEIIHSSNTEEAINELKQLDRQVFIAVRNDVFPIKLEMNKIYLN